MSNPIETTDPTTANPTTTDPSAEPAIRLITTTPAAAPTTLAHPAGAGPVAASEARRAQQRRRRILGLTVVAAGLAVVALGVSRVPGLTDRALDTSWWADAGRSMLAGWRTAVLNPWYWALVAALIVAERLLPARADEGTLNVGGAQDLVWTLLAPALNLTVVALAIGGLDAVYDHVLGGAHLDLTPVVGTLGVAVLAFLVADFGMWFTHLVRHKVPTLWHFHAVHHAPTRMNPLVDNRVHLVEPIASAALVLIPARLLGLDGQAALALALATTYFTAFTHANLRTNLGPLRFLLINPQAHRVHHSYAPEHIDTNFGTVLSIWDRMFGTWYHGEDEYPTVGIPDTRFPLETSATPGALVGGFVRQTAYPFRQCIEDIGRYRRR